MSNIGTFIPGICCDHEWRKHLHGERCEKCGATCTRDSNGKISMYSAGKSTTPTGEAAQS